MIKKALILLLCPMLLMTAVFGVSASGEAESDDAVLTRAAYCLAGECTVTLSGRRGEDIVFDPAAICRSLGVEKFDKITVASLPESGKLKVANLAARVGTSLTYENVSLLRFCPAAENCPDEVRFTLFCDNFCGGAPIPCVIRYADRENIAPTVGGEEIALETLCGIAVYGQLPGSDPDGDPLRFHITSYPGKGELTLTDPTAGSFCYKPSDSRPGRDSFTYYVEDACGARSEEKTVSLQVSARGDTAVFDDMEGNPDYFAAVMLCDRKVMDGSILGAGEVFLPDCTVSRADFTVMAMKMAGIEPLAATETSFDDNEAISPLVRGYIAAAHCRGIVCGSFDGKSLRFRPDDPITAAEAAVIVSRLLPVGEAVSTLSGTDSLSVPCWAEEAVARLLGLCAYTRGTDGDLCAASPLSRAAAARMLYNAFR